MAFQQLYYTSCETGLSGYAGFQFNAVTPGVSPVVMREVEQLTIYEAPRGLAAGPESGVGAYPVNLLHTRSESGDAVITARVAFTGADFSGRWGNYFVHALVSEAPRRDFADLMPIETWEAEIWRAAPVTDPDLPLVENLARGPLGTRAAAEFVDAPDMAPVVPLLLSAVIEAMTDGGPPVLLIGHDTAALARWIAVVSFLLGRRLAPTMTFATYSHQPTYCRVHVVGTVAAAGPFARSVLRDFRVFDFVESVLPELPVHGVAALLARVGVRESGGLWELAGTLAISGPEETATVPAWFPCLAVAALLRGSALAGDEADAVVSWLVAAHDGGGHDRLREVIESLLTRQASAAAALPSDRQRRLVDIARAAGLAHRAEAFEDDLVETALERLRRGEHPGEVAALTSERARTRAAEGCAPYLVTAGGPRFQQFLAWATAADALFAPDVLRRCGRNLVGEALKGDALPDVIAQAVERWPELRTGIVEELAAVGPDERSRFLLRDGRRLLRLDDFRSRPELGVAWLVAEVHVGALESVEALDRIVDLRRRTGKRPPVDEDLLVALWPDGRWTPDDARAVVDLLPPEELGTEVVGRWIADVLRTVPSPELAAGHAVLVGRLMDLRSSLGAEPRRILRALERTVALMDRLAQEEVPAPAVRDLFGGFDTAPAVVRTFIAAQAPQVILTADPLGPVLEACPPEILANFCAHAHDVLARTRDATLAARIFIAMRHLIWIGENRAAKRVEQSVLVPVVPGWKRREIDAVRDAVSSFSERRERYPFDLWLRQRRSARRRFLPAWLGRGDTEA